MDLQYNYFEMHYFFKDKNDHSMDANLFNKCQSNLLGIFEEIEKELDVESKIKLQVLPVTQGGLIQWFQSASPAEYIALGALATQLLQTILSRVPLKGTKEDKTLKSLGIEKRKLEIEMLKIQLTKERKPNDDVNSLLDDKLLDKLYEILMNNLKLRRHLSNLYKKLSVYEKITSINYNHYDQNMKNVSPTQSIHKSQFKSFVSETNEYVEIDENARIHIYSPNLVNSNHKWSGFYTKIDKTIDFFLADEVFKQDVLNKTINFRNGSMIDAVLKITIKYDDIGNETSRSYIVKTVLQKSDGDIFEETKQGKEYKYRKKLLESQKSLNFD